MSFPIGVFDSGVGGLSVLREIRSLLPATDLAYVADQAHVPYGSRSPAEVRAFAVGITRFLSELGARVVVVACNTASAAALSHLRDSFSAGLQIVGMEPAVKPAAEMTRSGVIGVLATPATLQGGQFAHLVERYAQGVTVLEQTCPGLVERIEGGEFEGEEMRRLLRGYIKPLLERGADALVLGCTHYPLALPLIENVAGPGVRVINPAPAVARQTLRVWEEAGGSAAAGRSGELSVYTSGDPAKLEPLLPRLLGEAARVWRTSWREGGLVTGR